MNNRKHLVPVAALLTLTACGTAQDAAPPVAGAASPAASAALARDDKLAAQVPAEIRTRGKLVIGTNAPYAPLEFFAEDNKTLVGFEIDTGDALGQILGLKVEWQNTSFDNIIPGLEAGRYDIGIAGFGIEKDRLEVVSFVSNYLSGGGFLVKKGSGVKVNDFKDTVCGLRVAVQSGTTQVERLEKADAYCRGAGKEPVQIIRIPDQNQAVLTLSSGRADVVTADKPAVEWAAKQSEGALCVTGTYRTPHSLSGIAIPKRNAALNTVIQAAMTKLIQEGHYKRLADKWGVVDGAIEKSEIFTEPGQVQDGDEIFPQPIKEGCA
ncbi:ABC transporter substrate-binding protein [Thermoactinospora rubra]|uniref:ABC transporter substrate-binding protein n=1 Tax=Thermoactinospora rubra TaxID=1088767 RepID=UPI00197F8C3E|nr:ABC transporter substrate-binding protein [Thermoactinospora rubra]